MRFSPEQAIAKLDAIITAQLTAIMSHPTFQRVERFWRSTARLIEGVPENAPVELSIASCSKNELRQALRRELPIAQGATPYCALVLDFEIEAEDADLAAELATWGHRLLAPVLCAAAPSCISAADFASLSNGEHVLPSAMADVRRNEVASYLVVCAPRVLLRPIDGFVSEPLWGSAAFALASRLISSFVAYGWCANIVRLHGGGRVDEHETDVTIDEQAGEQLAVQGICCLLTNEDGVAWFERAPSLRLPRVALPDESTLQDPAEHELQSQLPYLLIVCRFAHYLRVMARELLEAGRTTAEVRNHLQRWLNRYIADSFMPPRANRLRKPLRRAKLEVTERADGPHLSLTVWPTFRVNQLYFALRAAGPLV